MIFMKKKPMNEGRKGANHFPWEFILQKIFIEQPELSKAIELNHEFESFSQNSALSSQCLQNASSLIEKWKSLLTTRKNLLLFLHRSLKARLANKFQSKQNIPLFLSEKTKNSENLEIQSKNKILIPIS